FAGASSPDGRKIAFLSEESTYSDRLVVRDLTANRSFDLKALNRSPTTDYRLKWIGDTVLVLRREGMLPATVSKVNLNDLSEGEPCALEPTFLSKYQYKECRVNTSDALEDFNRADSAASFTIDRNPSGRFAN